MVSRIPGDPCFRSSAVNPVAVIPLLSTDNEGTPVASRSADSFRHLLQALQRHTKHAVSASSSEEGDLLLVIPNSSLSRPGDWRYSDTPLKAFHWQHGCQRVGIFDGRPDCSRQAHDRLMNHGITRDWIDLCPRRRTAAVIGVLNMHDCHDTKDLLLAEEELHMWAERYATPPYEVTAHGRSAGRDQPVMRLFVYDSFDEEVCKKIDLTKSSMGNSVLAFPPTDEAHSQMMDLHLNVVVNDLAVAIFRDLENKIRESDAICSSNSMQVAASAQATSSSARRSLTRIISGTNSDGKDGEQEPAQMGRMLTLSSMAGLVSPGSKLAQGSPTNSTEDTTDAPDAATDAGKKTTASTLDEKTKKKNQKAAVGAGEKPPLKPASASTPLLLTPLDDYWEPSELSGRDVEAIRKRDLGRREKFGADLSLLAGSPLDAYERYLKGAEMAKLGTPDPLWYAASLEGCAAAHIAMAEAGGYSIDEYLDNNFQLPDEFMSLVKKSPEDKRQAAITKQTLPDIVFALCEEALNIVSRHPRLAAYHAELLLKLAWYAADTADLHLRCRWGDGAHCYPGEPSDRPRWERTSVYGLQFESFKGENPVTIEAFERTKKVCELLHQATSLRSLDSTTRVDVASQAIVICLRGVKPMEWVKVSNDPILLPRKAAFFAAVAADAASGDSLKNAGNLWLLSTQLYSKNGGPTYGWGALRAACLSALSTMRNGVLALEAAEQLLSLLCGLEPDMAEPKAFQEEKEDSPSQVEADELASNSGHGSSAAAKSEQEGISSTANLFAKQLRESYQQIKSSSAFLTQQSKWAYDDPLPPQVLPLGDTSTIGSTLSNLKCVWTGSDLSRCAVAQIECMNRIITLRRSLPTPSVRMADFPTIYGGDNEPMLPFYVVSAKVIEADSQLEVQKIKQQESPKAGDDAMATFFNPFENKRRAGDSKAITSVAEGEERAFSVTFGNRLAVPLEVTRCQLEFRGHETSRVKATSLSFVIPPKSRSFTISFPFTVLPRSAVPDDTADQGEECEVCSIDFILLGRSSTLPIKPDSVGLEKGSKALPVSESEYPRKSVKKVIEANAPTGFPIQAYPCQPSLHIFYADSRTPFESLSIDLADGELYTSPALLLECYAGPSGHGNVEQLEIYISGITGPSQKLFDTSSPDELRSDTDFIGEMFDKEVSSPIRFRVVAAKLSLASVNGLSDKAAGTDNKLRIQVVASHSMARRLDKNAHLRLRFRYRGRTNKSAQVWRNHEIPVLIKLSKGARITCISFQPSIQARCFFHELSAKLEAKDDGGSDEMHVDKSRRFQHKGERLSIRLGQRSSINVCSHEIGILVTVLNETPSEVKLSRRGAPISSLGGHHFEEVLVRPSVSVKIPMLLKRFELTDDTVALDCLVDDLVSSTKLVWGSAGSSGEKAFGQAQIHPDCIKQLLSEYPSIASKLCEPPCVVQLSVNGSEPLNSPMKCSLGSPGVEISLNVCIAGWVSVDERSKCWIKMEFFCVRENNDVFEALGKDHVWAGKLRQKTSMAAQSMKHRARLVFCQPGSYIVTGCARIMYELHEEIWIAPAAQRVLVKSADVPANC